MAVQDREVAKAFQRALTKQGFKWKLGFKCNKAEREGDIVKLHVEAAKDGKKDILEANIVLVAAGGILSALAYSLRSPGGRSDWTWCCPSDLARMSSKRVFFVCYLLVAVRRRVWASSGAEMGACGGTESAAKAGLHPASSADLAMQPPAPRA